MGLFLVILWVGKQIKMRTWRLQRKLRNIGYLTQEQTTFTI